MVWVLTSEIEKCLFSSQSDCEGAERVKSRRKYHTEEEVEKRRTRIRRRRRGEIGGEGKK